MRSLIATAIVVSVSVAYIEAEDEFLRTPKGPYHGHIVDAGSGQPLAGAGVFMIWSAADLDGAAAPFAYREAETNDQGEFTIDAAAVEQNLPARALVPRFWVYRPGYQLKPDREREPSGASAQHLTKPGAIVQLIGARTHDDRTDNLNDFVAVMNRYVAPMTPPALMTALIVMEFNHLKTSSPQSPAATQIESPGALVHGPCVSDPNTPPPLAAPQPPRVPLPGQPSAWAARRAPYYGRVVDAQTRTPIAGAVVVAVWLRRLTYPFGATSEFYDACEVLTNTKGEFILDGRAIEARGAGHSVELPSFSVFYPGYSVYGVLGRKVTSGKPFAEGDVAAFHAVTIGLVKLQSIEERRDAVLGLPTSVSSVSLERIPHLVRILDIERRNLERLPNKPTEEKR